MQKPRTIRSSARIAGLTLGFTIISLVGIASLRYVKPELFHPVKTAGAIKTKVASQDTVYPYTKLGTEVVESPTTPELIPTQQFTVEIAVLENKEKALELVQNLNSKGLVAYYTTYNSKGLVYFRVRHGVFTTVNDAQPALTTALQLEPNAKIKPL